MLMSVTYILRSVATEIVKFKNWQSNQKFTNKASFIQLTSCIIAISTTKISRFPNFSEVT